MGTKLIRVKAKDLGRTYSGYYNHVRRKPGHVFNLFSESHFSEKWMERVEEDTPLTEAKGEPSTADLVADGFLNPDGTVKGGTALRDAGKGVDTPEARRAKEAVQGPAEVTGKKSRK